MLNAGAGDDVLNGGDGDDVVAGGLGTDIVELRGLLSDYTITAVAGGYQVSDAVSGRDGSDTLYEVETLRFGDGTTFSLAASSAPQVFPAFASDKAAPEPEVLPTSSDDSFLFLSSKDQGSPEVLPGMDDSFVLTAKFEEPPVMPAAEGEFDGVGLVRDMAFARDLLLSLAREDPLNPNVSADGLTLFDDGSGIASPTRPDVWG